MSYDTVVVTVSEIPEKEDRIGARPIRYQMFERLIEYLKRSVTIAWKSIFFNFKQYVYFFVAIIIVQMFFGVLTISNGNNKKIEREKVNAAYDYHILVSNVNEGQKMSLEKNWANTDNELAMVSGINDYFKVIPEKTVSYGSGEGKRYDLYIRFDEEANSQSLSELLVRFKLEYFPDYLTDDDVKSVTHGKENYLITYPSENGDVPYMFQTPLVGLSASQAATEATYWIIVLVLFVLSVFLMTMLYNIRVNQYKFTYGVYMTYGADFKMLFNTAFWEMFVITAICFIPSVLLSTVIVFFMYMSSGIGFTFPGMVFLWVFLFSVLVVTVAVFFPMRVMAVRMPMTLIVTEDNSNLVSSPKNSKNVFQKKFPTYYERISSWRFRKYSTNLLLTAIVFCAIFIMGLYLANIQQTKNDYRKSEFEVVLENEDDYVAFSEAAYKIDGVAAIEASGNYIEPKTLKYGSHMLVSPSDVKTFRLTSPGFVSASYNGSSMKATNGISFHAVDAEQIRVFDGLGYHMNTEGGDPNLVLQGGYVIIGDSYNNVGLYTFKPGDKIYVATQKKTGTGQLQDAGNLTGTKLLEEQIRVYKQEYMEFTIAAVLDDIPAGDTPIYFSRQDYEAVTGEKFKATNLSVYVDPDLSVEDVDRIDAALRKMAGNEFAMSVGAKYSQFDRDIAENQHLPGLFITISIMLLIISPIMWFFSQTLYYYKREQEFNILQAFGARVKDIRNIYLQGGLQMAGLSLIVSVVLSYLGSLILFYGFNVVIPMFSTGENAGVHIRYTFYMPWYAILISVVVSVGCGFLSAYLPYKSYYKHRFTLENGGAGAGED